MAVACQAQARRKHARARAPRSCALLQAKKRRVNLALIYDEVARKSWAERTITGDPEFLLSRAISKVDRTLLSTAEGIYDSAEADKAPSGKAEATGRAAGAAAPSHKDAGKGGWKAAHHKGGSSSGHGSWKRPQWDNWGYGNSRKPNTPPRAAKKARGSGP